MMLKKHPYRSKKYRLYVAGLPCHLTDRTGDGNDPHHIKGRGFGGSTKCSDLFCIPLSHALHCELHQIGWKSFECKHNFSQLTAVLATLERAFEDGVFHES